MPLTPKYPKCEHLKSKASSIEISEETKTSLLEDFRVLPLYETKEVEYVGVQQYSLLNNKELACRWKAFKKRIADRGAHFVEPCVFPKMRDLHFKNFKIVYDPSESLQNRSTNRYRMKAGPGFDDISELPIPDDTSLRPRLPKSPKRRQKSGAILKNKIVK